MYQVSKTASMNRLKNLLQYEASNYIHVAIIILLYYVSRTSYLGYLLLIPEVIFIYKKSKNILIYSFIFFLIISIRFDGIDSNEKNEGFPLEGVVTDVYDDHFILKTDTLNLCYYDDMSALKPGMKVLVSGYKVSTLGYNIPHVFDYDLYLKTKGIQNVFSINELDVRGKEFNLNILKYTLIKAIDARFDELTASYLKLFVLGENDDLNQTKQYGASLGISHIFAVSGMHIGLLAGMLLVLLNKTNLTIETNETIVIIFLIIYNIATGFKHSIVRASLLMTGIFLKGRFNILLTKTDLVAFSFLLMLIINPYSFYSIGFQLSYLISVSIILGQYLFKGESITKLIKITLFATMVGLPITLETNLSFGLIFVISNVFFVLFVSYIFLPMSFLVCLIPPLSGIYGIIIKVFELGLSTFADWNITLHFNFPSDIYKVAYWIILYLFIVNINRIKRFILLGCSLILLIIASMFFNYTATRFVRFLDVNQGDSIHIHDGGCDMLIDTGKNDRYDQVIKYLKANNTYQIDILLTTHMHDDHIGEVNDMIDQLDVTQLYVNQELTGLSNEVVISEGYSFTCGQSRFQVLHGYIGDSNENENSLVLYAEIGNLRYLFTGDIESQVETKIIEKYDFEIDVLKVSHHGSNTSSTEEIIKKMNAKLAIISVGEDNQYGFPNSTVLNRLNEYGYVVYRTDQQGTLTIYDIPFTNMKIIESYLQQKRRRYIICNI